MDRENGPGGRGSQEQRGGDQGTDEQSLHVLTPRVMWNAAQASTRPGELSRLRLPSEHPSEDHPEELLGGERVPAHHEDDDDRYESAVHSAKRLPRREPGVSPHPCPPVMGRERKAPRPAQGPPPGSPDRG